MPTSTAWRKSSETTLKNHFKKKHSHNLNYEIHEVASKSDCCVSYLEYKGEGYFEHVGAPGEKH